MSQWSLGVERTAGLRVWAGGGESLEAENKDALTWQQVDQDTEGWEYLETFFVWDIDCKLEAKGRPGQRRQ